MGCVEWCSDVQWCVGFRKIVSGCQVVGDDVMMQVVC